MENDYRAILRMEHDCETSETFSPESQRAAVAEKINTRAGVATTLFAAMWTEKDLLAQLAEISSDIISTYRLRNEWPQACDTLLLNLEKVFEQGISKLFPDATVALQIEFGPSISSGNSTIRQIIYSFGLAISEICYEVTQHTKNCDALEMDMLLNTDEIRKRIQRSAEAYEGSFQGFI